MRKFYKSEQSGRSMVEMLGVLAIIGVLSVAGIAGYSKAMAKFKVSKTLDQVSMLVANIRTIYAGQKSYTDLTEGVAINLGMVPQDMLGGTSGTITNAFNGKVTIGDAGTNDYAFYISYAGLSQEACASLLTSDWGSGSNTGLVAMSSAAGSTTIPSYTKGVSWGAANMPVSPVEAGTACAAGGNNSTVTWYYF